MQHQFRHQFFTIFFFIYEKLNHTVHRTPYTVHRTPLVLFTLFIGLLTFFSCKKDVSRTGLNDDVIEHENIVDRDGNDPVDVIKYLSDGQEITKDVYDAKDQNLWFHGVTKMVNGERVSEFHVFSTKNIYESWGVSNNIPVAKMNQLDAQIDSIANNLGITELVLAEQSVPQALQDQYMIQVQNAYNALFPPPSGGPGTNPFLYDGCRFYSCTNAGSNCLYAPFLPTYVVMPQWLGYAPWMIHNAQSWKFYTTFGAPQYGYAVTLRTWKWPFFIYSGPTWKKKHTAIMPQTQSELLVPFLGPIDGWKNRIESWMIFPS